MHPLLSVAAALALVAEPAPVAPPSPAPAPPAADALLPPPPAVRLAIVPFDAPADLALLGRSLADAVAQEAVKVSGFEVVGPAAVAEKLGDDGTLQASHCGDAAACLAAPARQLGVAWVVGGRIDRAGTNYRFGLVLVEVRTGAAAARAEREVPIASRRLRADVVAAAGPLLRGEAAGTGLLALFTELPGADVRIDDRPAGRTPLEVRLPAGKHKVEVSQRGKVGVEPFWVEVPAKGRAEQHVRLYDIPVAARRPGEIETTTVEMGKGRKGK